MLEGNLKADFPLTRELTYLDTAAEGLPTPECEAALRGYLSEKRRGGLGHERLFEMQRETEYTPTGGLAPGLEESRSPE